MKRGPVKDWGEHVYQAKEGKKAKITIYEKLCKACGICVEFCPVKILEIKGDTVVCINVDKCIKCMQCELKCPDFAIKVE